MRRCHGLTVARSRHRFDATGLFVSFTCTKAVLDVWQRARWPANQQVHWRALIWLARNSDERTREVVRSQTRLAQELCVSERHVRRVISYWRTLGVLRTLQHGGGRAKKAARYRFQLDRLEGLATPDMLRGPELNGSTPDIHKGPELISGTPDMDECPESLTRKGISHVRS